MMKFLSFRVHFCVDPHMSAAPSEKGKGNFRQQFGKAFLAGPFFAVSLADCALMSLPGFFFMSRRVAQAKPGALKYSFCMHPLNELKKECNRISFMSERTKRVVHSFCCQVFCLI